jgi:hypothetical protein
MRLTTLIKRKEPETMRQQEHGFAALILAQTTLTLVRNGTATTATKFVSTLNLRGTSIYVS